MIYHSTVPSHFGSRRDDDQPRRVSRTLLTFSYPASLHSDTHGRRDAKETPLLRRWRRRRRRRGGGGGGGGDGDPTR